MGVLCVQCFGVAQQPLPTTDDIVSELKQQHPVAALHDVNIVLKSRPKDSRLWTIKGLAFKQIGDNNASLLAFESALRFSPGYLPALEGAADIYYAHDSAKAFQYLNEILDSRPNDPTANSMAAMLYYKKRAWAPAVEHFSKSGESAYGQQVTLEAYADALCQLDRSAEAEPLLARLVNQWPDDRQARYNLAVLQLRGQQPANAAQTLQPLVEARNPLALSLAATAYEASGDTPRAVATLRAAIQQNPKDAQNYLDFAAISFDHASFAAGLTMLDVGLTQLPRSAPLWIAHGVLSMQNSQVERAESDFAMANHLDPSQSFGLEAEGLNAIQRHDLPGALTSVRASLRENPKSAYLNYLAAEILREQGTAPNSPQAQSAIVYAKTSVALDPKLTAARNTLSALYLQANEFTLAEQQCRDALQADPSDQEAVYRLILIARHEGDKQHTIPTLVATLSKLRSEEHTGQGRIDRYRLTVTPAADPKP